MILVVGGTGKLGSRVVTVLRAGGRDVRCLVRPGTDESALARQGADVVRGDLTEPASLPQACKGISTVVATATVIARRLAGARRPSIHQVDQLGMAALIDAAEEACVERFVRMRESTLDSACRLSAPNWPPNSGCNGRSCAL